ncbi:MAG: TolC family protein [Holophagales bacterium]|jgi:outer membrane protein TolC|nr:TolC family protein [Holophagales bacterium]
MLIFFPPALVDFQEGLNTDIENTQTSSARQVKLDFVGAMNSARSENPLLKAAKAVVYERKGLIKTVSADVFPQISISGDFSRVKDVSMLNSSFGDSLLGGDSPMLGIDPSVFTAPRSYYTTNISVAQPLFYFGKISTAIGIARMGEKEADQGYRTSELNVLHGVAKAYLAVLSAKAETEVIQSRMLAARQFLNDMTAKLEAQSATALDRLRAESELLAVMPDALQADANLKRAKEVLCGMLGLDPKTDLELADMGLPPELDRTIKGEERSEITQIKVQENMLEANDKIIKSDLLPKFDLSAQYGYQAGKTENMFKAPYDPWRMTISMRWPVFDGLRVSGRRAQNRAQIEQTRQMRINQERGFAVELQSAERELVKAKAFLEAARKALDTGQEALRVSKESFEQGLITSLDLLQAERTAHQLRSQLRRAELGVWSAIFDYRRSLSLLPN